LKGEPFTTMHKDSKLARFSEEILVFSDPKVYKSIPLKRDSNTAFEVDIQQVRSRPGNDKRT